MKQRQQSVNLNNEDDSTRQEAQTRKPATRTAFDSPKPWQGQRKAETFKAHKVLEQKRDAQTGRHDRHVISGLKRRLGIKTAARVKLLVSEKASKDRSFKVSDQSARPPPAGPSRNGNPGPFEPKYRFSFSALNPDRSLDRENEETMVSFLLRKPPQNKMLL